MVTKKETLYDVSIAYCDGGKDILDSVKSIELNEGAYEIVIDDTTTIFVSLHVVTHCRVEKVEVESKVNK